LRQQVLDHAQLWPRNKPRASAIASVVITGSDVDQLAGLLSMREAEPYRVYAPQNVLDAIAANPIMTPLEPSVVSRTVLRHEETTPLMDKGGDASGISVTAVLISASTPGNRARSVVALLIAESGRQPVAAYIPACPSVPDWLRERVNGMQLLLFDGSFWSEDEMAAVGRPDRSASSMGHIPISGDSGSLRRWSDVDIGRKVFIHINNTNRLLIEDSHERHAAEANGWSVAYDGQEFVL
jgi:pyrroloquinoline quinone biosynthesis protein B